MHIDFRSAPHSSYKFLSNLVVPRPIAWVTSKDPAGGLNLAPFSFFNLVGDRPPLVVLGIGDDSTGRPKHTARNIQATRDFVINLVTEDLAPAMNLTAANFPEGHSEFEAAGLTPADSLAIDVPRVANAQAALECTLHALHRIGQNNLIIGQVLALHIADALLDANHHIQNFRPIARLGGPSAYARTTDIFHLPRPTLPPPPSPSDTDPSS